MEYENIPEEVDRAMREVLEAYLPSIVNWMLEKGLLDRERLSDSLYVWGVIRNNVDNFLETVREHTTIHESFLEYAKRAFAENERGVAVVLLATALEQNLNCFYRGILWEKGLSEAHVTDIIKNTSFQSKLSWLISLTGCESLPEDLLKQINELTELRNCIVHYKAKPSSSVGARDSGYHLLQQRLDDLNFTNYVKAFEDLDRELESRIEATRPCWKIAEDVAQSLCDRAYKRYLESKPSASGEETDHEPCNN